MRAREGQNKPLARAHSRSTSRRTAPNSGGGRQLNTHGVAAGDPGQITCVHSEYSCLHARAHTFRYSETNGLALFNACQMCVKMSGELGVSCDWGLMFFCLYRERDIRRRRGVRFHLHAHTHTRAEFYSHACAHTHTRAAKYDTILRHSHVSQSQIHSYTHMGLCLG